MSDKLMKATRMAGIGFGALGGVAVGAAMALKPMIDKAADVEESLSKNNVVFGDSAKAVEQFAQRSLQAFGVTRREALEATGVIGTLGSAMGMAEADSAKMATTLVGLAGDMSSFNNASVEETLTAIQAGLRGENEPLRRFGVLLDAVTLKNKALEKGIIKNTKEALTPQRKPSPLTRSSWSKPKSRWAILSGRPIRQRTRASMTSWPKTTHLTLKRLRVAVAAPPVAHQKNPRPSRKPLLRPLPLWTPPVAVLVPPPPLRVASPQRAR
jgi:hypothetical protein